MMEQNLSLNSFEDEYLLLAAEKYESNHSEFELLNDGNDYLFNNIQTQAAELAVNTELNDGNDFFFIILILKLQHRVQILNY